ncbi:hypothetical protein COO60DRAFT_1636533 [Scenedesmus sp. NREL 46B-D3]|nr:hypothetical protein COO60DRAFT_1636533 [Scenedesmus sp. NREL 46B-D3]
MLNELGWTYGGNPCTGWSGVECNSEGYVSAINLANMGLQGSLPAESSLWGGLTGLTTLDLAGNALGGPVPIQVTAAGPQLASIPPDVCTAGDPSVNEPAAEQLGQYLAQACFPGQDMDTSICNCAQNLLGTDCAKARVNLCVNKDPNCLPFQNIIDVNGSSSAAAVGQVAPVLEQNCPIVDPSIPGVKATMEFPDLSMGQYITRQYTQNVANALSSVTNVPSTSISTLDVRPFTGSSSSGARRRALLQSSGNGVQATYFLATQDPAAVSTQLSQAANDGTLSTRLSQYGIQAQAGGLKVQSFLPPPPGSNGGSSGFPMWAIGVIIGAVVLLGMGAFLVWCCCLRKRRGKQAKEYAPEKKGPVVVTELPKSTYDYTPASPGGYMPVTASAAGVAAMAAGKAGDTSTAASGWRSNVRPASGQLPAAAGSTSSMAATAGKGSQQAERAKFWAQFQDTWQQVRQNQNIDDGEPGTPSSGTNWTDVTGTDSRR